ncbi:MAG: YkgJ family cysteine cluster protein [Desulforhopalus sp.]
MDQRKASNGCSKSGPTIPRWFHGFSITGLFHFITLKLRGRTILVTGSCHSCGSCCRQLSLEGRNGWINSRKEFQQTVLHSPEYNRFKIIGRDSGGVLLFTCRWLTDDGSCDNYEKRPSLCRNYPESSLLFCGGALPPGCGYRFKSVIPFEKILARELQKR